MIIDCFTFFNELDLLEIRLHTLSPYVDKFLICEADRTFQGASKPFHYHDNRDRFSDFDSKIIWCPLSIGMETVGAHGKRSLWPSAQTQLSAWEREGCQRRRIRTEILRLQMKGELPDSREIVVLLSDADEIPDLSGTVRANWGKSWLQTVLEGKAPIFWMQKMSYYWVDLFARMWQGTAAIRLDQLDTEMNGDFQALRNNRISKALAVYPGGWHFSFLGGVDAIKTKIEAFSHTEYRQCADEQNIRDAIGNRWRRGVDLFGRDIYKFRPLATEERERLPGYLMANRSRFSGLFMPDAGDQKADGIPG